MTRSDETRIGDTPRTLEQRLAEWQQQPGAYISEFEHYFINRMRDAARNGVGYGWMQQIIEWEWQSKGPGAWGPEYFHRELAATRREGWVMVPVEPTGEMWSVGRRQFSISHTLVTNATDLATAQAIADTAPNEIYRAMLAAVEKP